MPTAGTFPGAHRAMRMTRRSPAASPSGLKPPRLRRTYSNAHGSRLALRPFAEMLFACSVLSGSIQDRTDAPLKAKKYCERRDQDLGNLPSSLLVRSQAVVQSDGFVVRLSL